MNKYANSRKDHQTGGTAKQRKNHLADGTHEKEVQKVLSGTAKTSTNKINNEKMDKVVEEIKKYEGEQYCVKDDFHLIGSVH